MTDRADYYDQPVEAREMARSRMGRAGRLLILAGVLALALWAGLKGWRVYQATQSLLAVQDEANALLAGGPMKVDADAAELLVIGAQQDVATLQQELALFRPLSGSLGWVPRLGPALVAGPYLLDMAESGVNAAALSVSSLKPALAIVQREDFSASRLGELLPILTDASEDLQIAAAELERVEQSAAALQTAVDVETLPWRVRQLLALSDEWLPLAQEGLALAPQLPALLGQDGPRRYLVMAQNEDEMRPTGGYLTGAGVATVQSGQLIDMTFRDSDSVDDWRNKPYAFPPQPLYDYMGLELFLFRDSNFWPDFPTSAEKALDLYAYGQEVPPLDGAIAIDQEFLRLLVDGTGPIPVPGTDDTIDAGNLIRTLRSARDIQEGQEVRDWVENRKAFLSGFAAAILAKVETDFSSIDVVKLGKNVLRAAEGRHMQVYVRDPNAAASFAQLGWDGRLPDTSSGDFWMAVDANLGYNKANVFIERSLAYEVDITDAAAPAARLTVRYHQTGETLDDPCYQGVAEEYEAAAGYLAIADECYWNYLRVYVPAGSRLVDSSRHVVPGETLFSGNTWDSQASTVDEFQRTTTFSNFLLVPRMETTEVFFDYVLPPSVTQVEDELNVYRLIVGKQAGFGPEPLRIVVRTPPGTVIEQVTPEPADLSASAIVFEAELEQNMEFVIRYR